jgi:nicotinate phosphoribosyltransferase
VLAAKLFGIPVQGTHAHSWVMSFDSELESFERYAEVMPNNCVFLVDTYDTLEGVREAVTVGRKLRDAGHRLVGIRLDSGDLAYLSIEARKLLDEAGLSDATIVASNDLDEHIIESLRQQGAQIVVWGVGTKLVTGYDQPALGGVYKLGALKSAEGSWQPKVKLSEQAIKTSIPGILQVRRYEDEQGMLGDLIYDETRGIDPRGILVDAKDPTRRKKLDHGARATDLLVPVMRSGAVTRAIDPLDVTRKRARDGMQQLHPSVRRFLHPHEYPVGLDVGLHDLRNEMIRQSRHAPMEATP